MSNKSYFPRVVQPLLILLCCLVSHRIDAAIYGSIPGHGVVRYATPQPFDLSATRLVARRNPTRTTSSSKKSGQRQQQEQQGLSPVIQQLVVGGVGRSLSQMTLYPIDALRTLAQTRDGRTLKDVGASALIRGCTFTSSFALFMGSIQFAVYEACRQTTGPLLASAAGAVASCVVSVPQEVIKQRLVAGVYPSFRKGVATIFATDGIRGFYSAWQPTMARNVPFVMTTFITMDTLKSRRLKMTGKQELSVVENLAIGVSSAMVAGLLTNPADVIKTRMMTQAASVQVPYTSAWDCLTTIVKTEGPLTLWAGFKQRSVYMCSLWGMTFALNGKLKEILFPSSVAAATSK